MVITTRNLCHQHQGTDLQGYFAAPTGNKTALPAVLIAPAWAGCGAQAKERAEILAHLGYAAFAIDLYGQGRVGETREQCAQLMNSVAHDRQYLLDRLLSTLEVLRAQPEVDPHRIAAIGYCFGGLCVLDLARGGADLRGAISFHGIFNPPPDMPTPPIKARILVLHGFEDPMATPEQGVELGHELTHRGADWQFHWFGSTAHAFTNPEANDPGFGTVYNAASDQRSWRIAQDFLLEVLK